MESLDLTYNLIVLKINGKAPVQIYFMSQVFQEHSHCYDKRNYIIRKLKLGKFIHFCCHPFPIRTGVVSIPHVPPTFFTVKFLEIVFHRYMGILAKGR